MKTVSVTLVTPSPLLRWVLPIGLVCLLPLLLSAVVLPAGIAESVFMALRVVFVGGYLALLGAAMKSRRRPAQVHVDAEGLLEGRDVLVPRASIERVLFAQEGALCKIQLRGRVPRTLEIASVDDARALLAALDPDRETANITVLAVTTPVLLPGVVWIGVPVVLSMPLQYAMMNKVAPPVVVALAAPCVAFWIFATWWFARRRRVTVAATHLTLPRLFSTKDIIIDYASVDHARAVDAHTVEIAFRDRGAKRLKIYDPAELSEYVEGINKRRLSGATRRNR